MPITFLYPDATGGVKTFVKNFTEYLNSANVPFKVIAYKTKNSISTCYKKEGDYVQLLLSRYASRISNYKAISKHINVDDLLICNDSLEVDAVNYFKLKNKIVSVFHGDLEHYYKLVEKYCKIIDSIFCVSEGLVKKNKELFPLMDVRLLHPLIKNANKADLPFSKQLRIIYASRISFDKGADVLIDVINKMSLSNTKISWTIITTTHGMEKALLDKFPPHVKIEYDFTNDQVLNKLAENDILFFPSRTEGFGIVVLEAMKRGVVPIVNTLPYGIPDMIIDKQNGFITDNNNVDSICSLIEYLDVNRDVLKRTGTEAYNYANNKFDQQKIGSAFLKYTEEIPFIKKEKHFIKQQLSFKEKYFPEIIYRIIKWVFCKEFGYCLNI